MPDEIVAINKLKSPEGFLYAGYPKFMSLFGRDSLITSLSLINMYPNIVITSLKSLSKFQGKKYDYEIAESPGKIPHEVNLDLSLIEKRSKDVPWLKYGPNYFSVDSTPLYVITLLTYLKSKANDLNAQMLNSLKVSIEFLLSSVNEREFLGYDKSPVAKGLASQCWRDGIGDILERMKSPVFVSGVQAFLVEAFDLILCSGTVIQEFLGPDMLNEVRERLSLLRALFYDRFWIEEKGYPALAIDGDGVACRAITTDPLYCLGLGMMNRGEEISMVKRAMEGNLLTKYGIRCMSSGEKEFDPLAYQRGSIWPHDNFLVIRSLLRANFRREAEAVAAGVMKALSSIGSFPEYYSADARGSLIPQEKLRIRPCDPQAWTVGTFVFIKNNFPSLKV